jgi:hypothetical protein
MNTQMQTDWGFVMQLLFVPIAYTGTYRWYSDNLCLTDTLPVVTGYSGAQENWLYAYEGGGSWF